MGEEEKDVEGGKGEEERGVERVFRNVSTFGRIEEYHFQIDGVKNEEIRNPVCYETDLFRFASSRENVSFSILFI